MRLGTIKTADLLPRTPDIETRLAWVCNAFDLFIGGIDTRRKALSAPYSLEAIQALNDEELQRYYEEFGLAPYYSDLPRSARENMLYDQWRFLRKLGTKAAVLALCQYIFGDNPIDLDIVDNLAFDINGVLTNESLIDMYDAIITVDNPQLDEFQLSRIFANITRFGRVSQKLRGITMRYETEDWDIYSGAGSLDYAEFYDNDWRNCELYVRPTTLRIGIDTQISSSATGLRSKYYWFYQFSGGSSYQNLWTPDHYADNTNPSNPDPQQVTIPSSYYKNVWLWNGSSLLELGNSGIKFRLAVYPTQNGVPEFYTNDNTSANAYNSACVIELQDGSMVFPVSNFSLPSDLYTISGNQITWNTTHQTYAALYGKTADIIY